MLKIAIIAALVLGIIAAVVWYDLDHEPIGWLVVESKYVIPAHEITNYYMVGKMMMPFFTHVDDQFRVVATGVNKHGQRSAKEFDVSAEAYANTNPGDSIR